MATKVTMNDIAKKAGVGKSTVSRYFNGGYVKPETKEAIRKICEQYHYEPNPVAKMLKAKHTNTIGIISPTLTSQASSLTITEMDNCLKQDGYQTLIINTNHNEKREKEAFKYLYELNVDAIVILATHNTYNYQELQSKFPIPILFMGQEIKEAPSIIYNDYDAGLKVANYISKHCYKKLTYIGVSEDDYAVGSIRKAGVIDGLKANDITNIDYLEANFDYEYCYQIINEYLAKTLPDILICATNQIAIACYKILNEKQIKIGQDISIIAFGSQQYASLLSPPLTTIHFHNLEAGRTCAQTIIKMIKNEPIESCQLIGFELSEGQSVNNH